MVWPNGNDDMTTFLTTHPLGGVPTPTFHRKMHILGGKSMKMIKNDDFLGKQNHNFFFSAQTRFFFNINSSKRLDMEFRG